MTVDSIRSLIHPEDFARIETIVADSDSQNQTFQTEARIIRPTGQVRWCICAAAKSFDPRGRVKRVSGVTIDITDLKEAEARRTLLIQEIDHRARNALAVVQSIIRLTQAKSIDDYIAKIEGRIKALSTAHALLSESRWEGADLGQLVDEELAPYRQGDVKRFTATGPSVFLHPASAQSVALVLHELATNAAKYGAMSVPHGRVRVSWDLRDDVLALVWEEADGPPVQVPTSDGHGMMVINASVVRQLGGTVSFDWRPAGLRFAMSARISSEDAKSDSRRALEDARNSNDHRSPASDRAGRLLLVEDEELVGMMMKDMLLELGYAVIGPITRIADAMQTVSKESFHAAVLDINRERRTGLRPGGRHLGARYPAPVRDRLRRRGGRGTLPARAGAAKADRPGIAATRFDSQYVVESANRRGKAHRARRTNEAARRVEIPGRAGKPSDGQLQRTNEAVGSKIQLGLVGTVVECALDQPRPKSLAPPAATTGGPPISCQQSVTRLGSLPRSQVTRT